MAKVIVNVDDAVKGEASRLYESMGLNLSTAVNMFLRQSIVDNGLPFTPKAAQRSLARDTDGYPIVKFNMDDPRIVTPKVVNGGVVLPEGWDDDDD